MGWKCEECFLFWGKMVMAFIGNIDAYNGKTLLP